MRRIATLVWLATATTASAATPVISDPAVSPQAWKAATTAGATWFQNDFGGASLGPAIVQINSASDGSSTGEWTERLVLSGPLPDGAAAAVFPVADLEGRHLVRVTVAGAVGSPMILGELRLDRTPPVALQPTVTSNGDRETVQMGSTVDDGGLSGVDPTAALDVEVQQAAGGVWSSIGTVPPGGGPKNLQVDARAMTAGHYPVRVGVRDVAGNVAARPLGAFWIDRDAPIVSEVAVTRAPSLDDPTAEVTFRVADVPGGSGLDPSVPVRALDNFDRLVGTTGGGEGTHRMRIDPFGPGAHAIRLVAVDRGGRTGTSAGIQVVVPAPVNPAAATARSSPPELRAATGQAPGAVRWAFNRAKAWHATRGVALNASLAATASAVRWRDLVGAQADALDGYTTVDGIVAIGPAATRGLTRLAQHRACRIRCSVPSRGDADRMTRALAVLLHESLHATGPQAPDDLATPAGRAFEEGVTEAVTVDQLPAFIASLQLRPPLRRALTTAARRYRPDYPAQVTWIRAHSADVTGTPWTSRAAARWRLTVADTWGPDRWERLATATGQPADVLRALVPSLNGAG